MNPSRPPAPQVAPIERGGVRYEQLADGRVVAGSEHGGVLAACDAASGAILWTLRVYGVHHAVDAPFKPGRYFGRMALDDTGSRIVIETEHGAIYEVDLARRSSRWIGGVPEREPAKPPAKPKPRLR